MTIKIEPVGEIPVRDPMSADEARAVIDRIKHRVEHIRVLVLELYERRGWAALGYASWRACVATEFQAGQSTLYRQLQAALIEREISRIGKSEPEIETEQATQNGQISRIGKSDLEPTEISRIGKSEPESEKAAQDESISRFGKSEPESPSVEISRIGKNRPSPGGDRPRPIPETHLHALAKLPEGDRKAAWEEARAAAPDGKVTAALVRAVVAMRLGTPPAVSGKSRVNGVLTDDPPDVAAARARGKIGADVVPEVTEAEAGSGAAEPEPAAPELSDEDWLATLPARAHLSGPCLKTFDEDALLYRRLEAHRTTFKYHASRLMNKCQRHGAYRFLVRQFLGRDDPKRWLVCPATEDGGCGGSGQVTLIGQCVRCHGRGYWVK